MEPIVSVPLTPISTLGFISNKAAIFIFNCLAYLFLKMLRTKSEKEVFFITPPRSKG